MDKISTRFLLDKLLHKKPKEYQNKVYSYMEHYLEYSNKIGIDLVEISMVINYMILLDIELEKETSQ